MLRVTLDTNAVNQEGLSLIEAACAGCDVDSAHTTVTDREQDTSFAAGEGAVTETGVWDESHWDRSVWGGSIPETTVVGESRLGAAGASIGS